MNQEIFAEVFIMFTLKAFIGSTFSLLALTGHASSRSHFENVQNPITACQSKDNQTCLRDFLSQKAVGGLNTISYDEARKQIFTKVDVEVDENGRKVVHSCYSKDVYVVDGRIPDDKDMNVEHSWPQSKLKRESNFSVTRSDLFHLYPSDSKLNSERGSNPFTEFPGLTNEEWKSRFSSEEFEPPVEHRGRLARSMLYMAVAHGMQIDSEEESLFKKWNSEYPVQDSEKTRAERIQQAQGNMNPFIENPSWVDLIENF
jgi:deoxyribonuclease I